MNFPKIKVIAVAVAVAVLSGCSTSEKTVEEVLNSNWCASLNSTCPWMMTESEIEWCNTTCVDEWETYQGLNVSNGMIDQDCWTSFCAVYLNMCKAETEYESNWNQSAIDECGIENGWKHEGIFYTAGYSFATSCKESDETGCGSCCLDIEFDTSYYTLDYGCGCAKWDLTSCAHSTDSSSCDSCCENLGANYGLGVYVAPECGCLWNGE